MRTNGFLTKFSFSDKDNFNNRYLISGMLKSPKTKNNFRDRLDLLKISLSIQWKQLKLNAIILKFIKRLCS